MNLLRERVDLGVLCQKSEQNPFNTQLAFVFLDIKNG